MAEEKEIIKKLIDGKIKLHQIENFTDDVDTAVNVRRKFVETISSTKLEHLSKYSLSMEDALKRNIENPIGTVQIPVGVAGPLIIQGEHANGEYYVPIATSEGALVASINRGFSVIKAVGGVTARIIDDKMTRAPVIKTESVLEALEVKNWIKDNFSKLKQAAESTTRHGELVKIESCGNCGKIYLSKVCL